MNQIDQDGENAGSSDDDYPSLIVGRDGDDHWVVVETHGICGGLFTTEAAAMRYAREESGGRPGSVRRASHLVALNLRRAPSRRLPAQR